MNEQVTNGTQEVENENAIVVIGGTELHAYIKGEIDYTYTSHPGYFDHRGIVGAEPPSDEITLDSVKLTVTLYGSALGNDEEHCIQFVTNSIEFYEKHFGELESSDVDV